MDAMGLSLLAAGLRHARRNGGSVRVAAAPRHVRKLLTMTQMNQRIPGFGSLPEAPASPK
jgi:ABC-type transporter Mla MlaB component